MRIRTALAALSVAACLTLPALATAQTVGVYSPAVSADQAQDIAVINGVIALNKIEFDDRKWKVKGLDRAGRRVEMEISPNTGEIIRLERFD
jgi:hypothetical protein